MCHKPAAMYRALLRRSVNIHVSQLRLIGFRSEQTQNLGTGYVYVLTLKSGSEQFLLSLSTPIKFIYMYVYIYQRVHELPSRCIKEPPEAPVTATLIEGKKKDIHIDLFFGFC